MSWFNEQLRYREETDTANFEDAIDSIAAAVMGKRLSAALDDHAIADSAIDEILKYYHHRDKIDKLPPNFETIEEQLEYRMRPYGIQHRVVQLDEGWYKHAAGAMIGTMRDSGAAVALIPGKISGYRYMDLTTGNWVKLSRKTEKLIDREAVCFYQPLPQKSLTMSDLLRFMIEQLNISDIVLYFGLMAAVTLLGMLSPMFTKWLFSDVLESGSTSVLLALAVFMVCFSICRLLFSSFQALINSRVTTKQNIAVQAAVMSRMLSLPPRFFRDYAAGELTQRSTYVQSLCSTLFSTICSTGFSSLFSLVYIGQVFAFAPALVVPSLLITLITILLSVATTFVQMRITRKRMEFSTKTSGLTYATITGIQKIKLAGAEKRMFSRWAKQYAAEATMEYNPPIFLRLSSAISLALSLTGTLLLYALAVRSGVSVANYYAFNSAYGMVSGAFMSFAGIASSIANIKPTLEMARPILEAEPEKADGREIVTELRGGIEMSHISFAYDENMPNVIDDLSLKISAGEYVAIVGSTGCGKSTLVRLLLGFERPQKGSIFFDRKDISCLDPESLRRNIGVVMQDGKLVMGDIYSNIVIAAPQLTLDEAWEAAEIADIADDIRRMPMGMNTMISEGQGGISGGQRQRLMIARAIAPKPKILIFDEATSALDNLTQKKVSDAIDALKCTRIVIAHRLSTIQHADRIIFLDKGNIAEEGTYEELIERNGLFADLVARQRLDIDAD